MWVGLAPTVVGVLLALFWGGMVLLRQPIRRFWHRMIGIFILVLTLSMWLGYNGEGGQLGSYVAQGAMQANVSGLVLFLLVMGVIVSTPLATDWFFLPLIMRLRAARALTAQPMRGTVGRYEVRGGFAHDDLAAPVATEPDQDKGFRHLLFNLFPGKPLFTLL